MKKFLKFILSQINRLDKNVNAYQDKTHKIAMPSKAYLQWGINLAVEGKMNDALEKFEMSANMPLQDPENFVNWGIALAKLHRYEEAIRKFNSALNIDKTYSSAYSLKGAALVELNRTEEAFECYNIAAKFAPYDSELYINWGIALAKLDQKPKAEQKFRKALSLTTTNVSAAFLLGVVLYEQNKLTDAMDAFELTVTLDEKHLMAFYYLSLINTKLCNFKKALEIALHTVHLAPFRIDFIINLAECYYDVNNVKEAIRTYFSIRKVAGESFMYLISAGIFWQKVKKYKKSLYFLEKAVEKPQADYLTKYYLAVTYAGLNRFVEAKDLFIQISEEEPDFYDAQIKLALIYKQEETYSSAVEILENIFKKTIHYNKHYYILAECYRLNLNADKAVSCYKKMLEYFPNDVNTQIALAKMYFLHFQDYKNAMRTIRSAYKINSDNIQVNILFALILAQEGSFDEALTKINHALELDDNFIELYLRKLFILKKSPYKDLYIECLEFVKNKFPDKIEYICSATESY